jgi:epoxide hydrolase-like protein
MIQKLAEYWATQYDWRKCEARLAALPHFVTEIDGLDIHFIHVRSKHDNALPLIVSHGWPGSIVEQMKIIDPLVNPTAQGASASDAFDVVIPSMPGYGYSGRPANEHRGVWRPSVLGDVGQARILQCQGHLDPRCRELFPGRNLHGSAELGRTGVLKTDPLQQGR